MLTLKMPITLPKVCHTQFRAHHYFVGCIHGKEIHVQTHGLPNESFQCFSCYFPHDIIVTNWDIVTTLNSSGLVESDLDAAKEGFEKVLKMETERGEW
jgi:hypothetical protein